jgi:hypothetical protein
MVGCNISEEAKAPVPFTEMQPLIGDGLRNKPEKTTAGTGLFRPLVA